MRSSESTREASRPPHLGGVSRLLLADVAAPIPTSRPAVTNPARIGRRLGRANEPTPAVVGPTVGFRAWHLDDLQMYSLPRDVRPGCLGVRVGSEPCPVVPAMGCNCGLPGEYEISGQRDAKIWSAVQVCGNVVLSDSGFRSEWQRPILLAAPRRGYRISAAIHQAAAACGANVVSIGQLATAAKEYGQSIPSAVVPITPLSLLSQYQRQPLPPYPWTLRKLARRVTAGSVDARWMLASYAVDVAVAAALSHGSRDAGSIVRLEAALTGLAVAVEHWTPDANARADRDHHGFRAAATTTIRQTLSIADEWGLDPPTTYSWGQVRQLGFAISSAASARSTRLSTSPLDADDLLHLIDRVAFRPEIPGELGDRLAQYLSFHLGYP
jgi:hypothetical protein